MNERIKSLLAKAHLDVMEDLGNIDTNYVAEKFAELIVRECVGCCEQVISDPVPKSVDTFEQGGIHCMDAIKQHFGVDSMSTEDKKTLIKELLGVKE